MFVKMFQNGDAWFQSSRNGRWKLNPNIACSNQFGSMSTNIFSKTPPLPVACQAPLAGLEQRNPWKILPAVRHNQIGGKMLQKLCHSRARYPQFSRLVVVLVWARFYRGLVRRADLSCWHFNLGSEIWLHPLGRAAKSCGRELASGPAFNCSHKPHRLWTLFQFQHGLIWPKTIMRRL